MAQSTKLRVLVVDDSGFFQRRVSEIINADPRLEVIATASNGKEGVEKALALKPDVITMDYEMPVMDGVAAVKNIMSQRPTPILMFSSLTYEGARITLDALEAGAVDFLSKQFDAIAASEAELHKTLTNRLYDVASAGVLAQASHSNSLTSQADKAERPASSTETFVSQRSVLSSRAVRQEKNVTESPATPRTLSSSKSLSHVSLVIIGTSTGGPAALQTIFKNLPEGFSKPIVIVQHMPASFTNAFAERLNKISSLTVTEAKNGEQLKSGHVYVAPGGKQLMVDNRQGGSIHIHESDERISYRPSVDIALASAAKHFGRKALAIILTGMGADGKEGAQLLKQVGGVIWAQDEASCVIYGMPMAVVKAGVAAKILALNDIGTTLFDEAN